jgi:ATP-dependent Lon protease
MKENPWADGLGNNEDVSLALFQRTDELYQIPDAKPDDDGLIELNGLVLRDFVVYPRMVSPIFVSDDQNQRAMQEAEKQHETLIALYASDASKETIDEDSLLPIGVEVAAGRLLNLSEGSNSALVQGRRRVEIVEITGTEPFYRVKARPIEEPEQVDRPTQTLMRTTRDLFERCVQLDRSLPEEAHLFSLSVNEPGWLADLIATTLALDYKDRIKVLLITRPKERLRHINWLLAQELDVLQLEDEIQTRIENEVDRSQREFYLREQMKAIQTELGEKDFWAREIDELRERIEKKGLPAEVRSQALKELDRLAQVQSMAPEFSILRNYLDWILDLPWTESTPDDLDITHAAAVLENHHYGLQKAKDRILEYIAVRSLIRSPRPHQPILCFVGPPGTGKTSLGRSIAEALGRKFVRVSLGGIRDEAEIRGHRRTYVGALPGRILQTMAKARTINPVFMLDEIDKVGMDFRGDPSAALLEVLDPEQNYAFSDHYLELPYDLSQVIFITTANTLEPVPPALLDRMELIEFPGYIEEEKLEIAKRFLIPRQLEENGLAGEPVTFRESALRRIIQEYTYEAGVRGLERQIGQVARKLAKLKSERKRFPKTISARSVEPFLGPPEFFLTEAERKDESGVATAMAWTESGGEIMPVEVLTFEGKGILQITGQVGDVMQESAQAALSYLKAHSADFGVEPRVFENTDVHIHIPEGAIPKDGPSAGITIATALVSAFSGRMVHKEVAMTGEITLRGMVLPVGGIREKVLSAHRAGLKKVILPEKNLKDLVDVPKKVLTDLEIIPVTHMDQVLGVALYPPDENGRGPKTGTAGRSKRRQPRENDADQADEQAGDDQLESRAG